MQNAKAFVDSAPKGKEEEAARLFQAAIVATEAYKRGGPHLKIEHLQWALDIGIDDTDILKMWKRPKRPPCP